MGKALNGWLRSPESPGSAGAAYFGLGQLLVDLSESFQSILIQQVQVVFESFRERAHSVLESIQLFVLTGDFELTFQMLNIVEGFVGVLEVCDLVGGRWISRANNADLSQQGHG